MIDSFTGPLTKSQRAFEAWHLEEWEYEHRMKRRGFTFMRDVYGNYYWDMIQKQWAPWRAATEFMESVK